MIKKGLLGLATQQAYALLRENHERRMKYTAASMTAEAAGKPFLVVGGPFGGKISGRIFGMQAHGCGDICLDMDSRACGMCNFHEGDIRNIPFNNKEFGAVFCSHVLEHMYTGEDCAQAWWELNRVADTVFVCLPGKDTIIGWIASGHRLWVSNLGSGVLKIQERNGGNRFIIGDTPSAGFIGGSGATIAEPDIIVNPG